MKVNKIYNMDCLQGMKEIPDESVDMILTDLPYGITECKWDNIIPFTPLWEQYNRIAKERAAVVLFSVQPFTTKLINSNIKNFRYCWYWKKNNVTGAPFSKSQPMRCIEDICVFYKQAPTYNPQGLKKLEKIKIRKADKERGIYQMRTKKKYRVQKYTNYPVHLLQFANEAANNKNRLHPTQKPLALCEYLIKTYTNAGDTVFDSCAGSGTTLLAAKKNDRQYIGFEADEKYYNIAVDRLKCDGTALKNKL